MMLVEQTAPPPAAFPVEPFKDHLRLGRGFADDGVQDGVLERVLRAALAAIEARTGKVTLSRDFTWTVDQWRDPGGQALPVAPVEAVNAVTIRDRGGAETAADPARYALVPDGHRPRLVPTGAALPPIPAGGLAEISFRAGFGTEWGALPADLAQAVFLLAAHYYENRDEAGRRDWPMPHGVNTLIARYRTVRLLAGRGRP